MTKLKILTYPDPTLHRMSAEVQSFDTHLARLLDDMAETMYAANGVGLAGPQVGQLQRLTVVDISENCNELKDFVNPQIVWRAGTISSEEGCLSIPEYRDVVKRSAEIVVRAKDRHGKEFELKTDGLLARCLQHEIDHLDGVLFVDKLSRLKKELFRRWLKKQSGE